MTGTCPHCGEKTNGVLTPDENGKMTVFVPSWEHMLAVHPGTVANENLSSSNMHEWGRVGSESLPGLAVKLGLIGADLLRAYYGTMLEKQGKVDPELAVERTARAFNLTLSEVRETLSNWD